MWLHLGARLVGRSSLVGPTLVVGPFGRGLSIAGEEATLLPRAGDLLLKAACCEGVVFDSVALLALGVTFLLVL